jgi:hypothetical protein
MNVTVTAFLFLKILYIPSAVKIARGTYIGTIK